MKRKLIISALLTLFVNVDVAVAQMDSEAKEAILTLLLSKPVSEKIFIDYPDGRWSGPFDVPGGKYVFIPPNATFRSVYPSILDEMPYTISTDSLLHTRTMYRDSVRGVFISQNVGFELFTVFELIQMAGDSSQINFFTSSSHSMEQYEDRYILVKSKLIRSSNGWTIKELNIERIEWRDYFK
jgi:hypothetical protein